jgi:hypothetical protein
MLKDFHLTEGGLRGLPRHKSIPLVSKACIMMWVQGCPKAMWEMLPVP